MSLSFSTLISSYLEADVLSDIYYQTPGAFNIPPGLGSDCVTSITVGGTNNANVGVPSVSIAAAQSISMSATTVSGSKTLSNLSFQFSLNGNTTLGSNILNNLPSTALLSANMNVSGTGIPANTVIQQVLNSTSVVLSAVATSSNVSESITFSGGDATYFLSVGMGLSDSAVNIANGSTIAAILGQNSVQMSAVALATHAAFTVTVSGVTATAYAVLAPTSVASLSTVTPGTGLSGTATAISLVFSTDAYGDGTGATGHVTALELVGGTIVNGTGNGSYVNNDVLDVTDGANTTHSVQATITVTVSAGVVTSFVVTASGTYSKTDVAGTVFATSDVTTSAATGFTFIPIWGAKTVTLTAGGSGFTTVPNVTIAGSTGGSVLAVLTATPVASFVVTNPGSLYTSSAPTVTVSGSSTNTTGTAVLGTTQSNRILTMIEIMRAFFAGAASADEAKLEYYVLTRMLTALKPSNRGSYVNSSYNAGTGAADSQIAAMNQYVIHSQNLNSFTSTNYSDAGSSVSAGESDI